MGEITSKNKNHRIFRACVVRQATPPHPHELCYCLPQPVLSKMWVQFVTKVSVAAHSLLSALALLRE